MRMRVGTGYDVHRLAQGYPLWLGGVRIESTLGAVGHSDADTLIHAICDALLGAAGLRDIGYHFPDSDPGLKGIDSKIILARTAELLRRAGYSIGNIDSTVCLQRPKIQAHIPQMQLTLEQTLGVAPGTVTVKATTTEGLGFVGRGEGVAAHAVAAIFPTGADAAPESPCP